MVPNGSKCSQMVSKCLKWYQMFPIGPKSIPNFPKFTKMVSIVLNVPNGSKWLVMVPNCLKWSQMLNGSQMVSNSPRWSQIAPNSPQLFQPAQHVPNDNKWSQWTSWNALRPCLRNSYVILAFFLHYCVFLHHSCDILALFKHYSCVILASFLS